MLLAIQRKIGTAKTLILVGFVAIIVSLILFVVKTHRIYRSLLEQQNMLNQLGSAELMELDPAEVGRLMAEVRNDIIELNSLYSPFLSVAPAFGWLPVLGPTIKASPALMEMALAGSEAGVLATDLFIPILKPRDQELSNHSRLTESVDLLEDNQRQLLEIQQKIDTMQQARSKIKNTEQLPMRLRSIIDMYDSAIPTLIPALKAAQAFPELMGSRSVRNYLILAQNEDEIRPSGGFISGVGVITVRNGAIQNITFQNANLIDAWQDKPYGSPPAPYQEFMGMDLFLLRDANFWPDFPTTAQAARYLFTYGQGLPIDGVIAIDQKFLVLLLETLGSVYIDEFEADVNASNVVNLMRQEWGPQAASGEDVTDWIRQRKEFMEPLSQALFTRIMDDGNEIDFVNLVKTFNFAAKQRHLQVWMADPAVSDLLKELGWDGHFSNDTKGDFVGVIDTNIGFNKVNANMESAIHYHIELEASGTGRAELTIIYDNTRATYKECDPGTTYSANTQYSDLFNDCYWNYLRVYVPSQAELLESSVHPVPGESLLVNHPWEGNARVSQESNDQFTVIENLLLVPTRTTTSVHFDYLIPGIVNVSADTTSTYRLLFRKQAGEKPQLLEVIVKLPEEAVIVASSPEAKVAPKSISFQALFTSDVELWVQFRVD